MSVINRLNDVLGDRYRIERELGAGGMATVFLARDVKHGREVAIKVLNTDVAESLGRERFLREIRLAASLTHPHILPLYDSGQADEALFFVMPVMQGRTLRDLLDEQRQLPVEMAVRLASEVAGALDYAHRHDIVHRDIKPENILLHDGHAIVADFGIGKAIAAATPNASGTLTQIGMVVGTPAYMSPEQALGQPLDGRSDLFSLGCILYEMLTGEQPYAAPTVAATIARRLSQTPASVTTLRATVPTGVSAAVTRLLALDASERIESGARVLELLRTGEVLAASPPSDDASVAVLPFANMSADPDNDYFADGITDDVIVALTGVKGLRVAARTSSFAFKGKTDDLGTIGRTLNVRTVLQGSIRRAGSRVRITVQLMHVDQGSQLWSERYDRELDDIFAIQDEIARTIVERLQQALGLVALAPAVHRPTDDLEAYQLYLRGREAVWQRTPSSLKRAAGLFREALARDPNYARAYLGLAEVYIVIGSYSYIPVQDAARDAADALAKAELLQGPSSSLHVLRGQLKLYLREDWPNAEDDLVQALALDPNNALAHAYLAIVHGLRGRFAECRSSYDKAVALDPLSVYVRSVGTIGFPYEGVDDCNATAALQALEEALALDANSVITLWFSAVRLGDVGRAQAAIERNARAMEMAGRAPVFTAMWIRTLAIGGQHELANAERDALRARVREEGSTLTAGDELTMIRLDWNDEMAMATSLLRAVTESVSTSSLYSLAARDLEPLLDHPTLGAMVRALPFWQRRPVPWVRMGPGR